MKQVRKKPADQDINDETHPVEHTEPNFRTPSWFVQEPSEQNEDKLSESFHVERPTPQPYFETPMPDGYEAYRKRIEQRFKEGQALYDRPNDNSPPSHADAPQQRRPTLPIHEIQGRKKRYKLEQESQFQGQVSQKNGSVSWVRMITLGTVAICIGTLGGLSFSNVDLIKQKYQASISTLSETFVSLTRPKQAQGQLAQAEAKPHETVIVKKTIATATLEVADVKGSLGSMIPLMLSAQNTESSEPFSLKISGLPKQAYLTAGVESAQGSWILKPSELSDVKLVVPQSDVAHFDMEVAAIEDRTGALVAPVKAMDVQLDSTTAVAEAPLTQASAGKANAEIALPSALVPPAIVYPVNAAPDTAVVKLGEPSAIPNASSEAVDLVSKGNTLLQNGDIISARQFFLRASELGNAQGSFGVARTYDPKIFTELNVVGLQPNAALAADWYQKAAQAGVVSATQ